MAQKIILASSSPFRRTLLENAGLTFSVQAANIDERAAEAPLLAGDVGPQDIALVLAEAKAGVVSDTDPDALIIGADQTLSLGDELLHKPADMDAARKHLLKLSGRTHQLNSAVVLVQNGRTLWRHVDSADLTMRDLNPGFIGRYLSAVGDKALLSVGAYQLEGRGIQLFDTIKGDYFTIIGLPILPLLDELRRLEAIDG
ncbi:MAG: Maf-like protein [Alphaproteobacteria bacterium]|nr:Maf-like protein [Alphaproteobacteria bacterium]